MPDTWVNFKKIIETVSIYGDGFKALWGTG